MQELRTCQHIERAELTAGWRRGKPAGQIARDYDLSIRRACTVINQFLNCHAMRS